MLWLDLGLFLEVGLDLCASPVSRRIVNDYYVVIFIILHDDGLDVAEMAMRVGVVEGRDDDTERQFFVLADAVFLLEVGLLFIG